MRSARINKRPRGELMQHVTAPQEQVEVLGRARNVSVRKSLLETVMPVQAVPEIRSIHPQRAAPA